MITCIFTDSSRGECLWIGYFILVLALGDWYGYGKEWEFGLAILGSERLSFKEQLKPDINSQAYRSLAEPKRT